ncbi:MAG: hypothetical protein IID52_00985 [Proteobacteria bacterium]|nr:hypothetical protein [Pseudomonadota bacterium]MCH8171725.1 hypothetical protein [Pseudomonadota bacterium]
MKKMLIPLAAGALFAGSVALADEDMIVLAMSAGPDAIASEATIMLPDGTVLREGSDYWTCFPYIGENVNSGPVCADPIWTAAMRSELVDGHYAVDETGVSYMLAGDLPHIMVIIPGAGSLEGFNSDFGDGKTWVMSQPAPHLMIPIEMDSEEEAPEADE